MTERDDTRARDMLALRTAPLTDPERLALYARYRLVETELEPDTICIGDGTNWTILANPAHARLRLLREVLATADIHARVWE